MPKGKNCPNCGAVYEPEKNKCPYCGTSYYDMSAIDFEDGAISAPVTARARGNNRTVTTATALGKSMVK